MVNVGQNSASNNPGSNSILNTVTPFLAILAFITTIIALSTDVSIVMQTPGADATSLSNRMFVREVLL